MSNEIEQLVEVTVVLRLEPEVHDAIVKDATMWQVTLDEVVTSVVHAKFTTKMPHENHVIRLRRKGIEPSEIGTSGPLPDDEYGY